MEQYRCLRDDLIRDGMPRGEAVATIERLIAESVAGKRPRAHQFDVFYTPPISSPQSLFFPSPASSTSTSYHAPLNSSNSSSASQYNSHIYRHLKSPVELARDRELAAIFASKPDPATDLTDNTNWSRYTAKERQITDLMHIRNWTRIQALEAIAVANAPPPPPPRLHLRLRPRGEMDGPGYRGGEIRDHIVHAIQLSLGLRKVDARKMVVGADAEIDEMEIWYRDPNRGCDDRPVNEGRGKVKEALGKVMRAKEVAELWEKFEVYTHLKW
ncbi:hypothetical protein BJ878DRAFT_541391 [Calycina marina]|uniref:Uncharacterized protein n=1 Tax=Calycina marina TaxID=1763456 RepID=A0A9P7Z4X7_9HELO|nr:hypothetical protein BJ878DRAFT_541391 [Calycina marina]